MISCNIQYSGGSKFPKNSYGKGVMLHLLTKFFKRQRREKRLRSRVGGFPMSYAGRQKAQGLYKFFRK